MSDPILPSGEAGLRELYKAIVLACNDPGHFVGYKGDRSLGEWQADALLAGPLAQIQSDRTRLEAENERLRAALRPFARAISEYSIRGADLRAATAALAQPQPEERGPLPLDPSPQGEGGGETTP